MGDEWTGDDIDIPNETKVGLMTRLGSPQGPLSQRQCDQ